MGENELDLNNNLDLLSIIKGHDFKLFKKNNDVYDIIDSFLENNVSDEAFYIIDIGKVISQYNRWTEKLPLVKPYYAIKCNPNPVVIKVLSSLGCNFDCASKNEIAVVNQITGDPSRIIFANPCKMSNQIKYARANDIDLMTFDCDQELYKIKLYHPYADLVLRIAVDDSGSLCKFNKKFGCKMEDVESILTLTKTMGLTVVGVSFHVGSGCTNVNNYNHAIQLSRKVFDIAAGMGIKMDLLDIGGGFPGSENEHLKFEEIADVINEALVQHFGDMVNDMRIIAEPGRYMVANSHILVLNVIGKKVFSDKDNGVKRFTYYLNDGVYGSFNCIYFDHAKPNILAYNERHGEEYTSVLFGPTCDSLDIIAEDIKLPELAIGEWIFVEHFGAYTSAAASTFNGFQKTNSYYIIKALD
jgi:ornithine decarboxylase